MLIGIIGENCSGKPTLAGAIQRAIGAEIITGKDYLRMARSEGEARAMFQEKLTNAISGDNVFCVNSGPVERMPERKHGMFGGVPCDYRYDGAAGDAAWLCSELMKRGRRE